MEATQMNLFEASYEKAYLPKHVRLIELFAGIGAQSKALEILGADFEIWRTCEWSWQSIMAYNAIHKGGEIKDTSSLTYEEVLERIEGVSNDYEKPMSKQQLTKKGEEWARNVYGAMLSNNNFCPNVSKLHASDLQIEDKEHNTYILFFSFPCQDLSVAGQQKGMERGSGTRSGLLWEVERILLECKESDCLPQALVMENVPLILSGENIGPFNDLIDSFHEIGYTSYYKIMNAVDYGIPQSRERCFMVSILGNHSYSFPKPMELKYNLNDFMEKEVDESYFLPDEWAKNFEEYEQ